MVSGYLHHAVLFVSLLQLAAGQQSNIVPSDIGSGEKGSGTEIQASYTNRAVDGFKDGTTFEKDAVSKEPTFALGDSSGISPTILYTILMVDTTCSNKRVLHYARANFKNNFDITNIATDSAALQAYKAPGAFGEKGDNRQYSFLMYINPDRKQIAQLQLPAEGEAFDVKKFQSDNGFPDPSAGVGMVVKLGGTADCSGDAPNAAPSSQQSSRPAASSTAARTSNVSSNPTSSAAAVPTSNTGSGTTSSAAVSRATSAGNTAPTSVTSSTRVPGNSTDDTPVGSGRRTSGIAAASSALEAPPAGPSTITSTTIVPNTESPGTPTSSVNPALQSVNAAPGTSVVGGVVIAPLLMIAGAFL